MIRTRDQTLRIAHRGDWRRASENTLPALLAALQIPACNGVEFDVRTSRDGVPVLQHDETLARVHGRPERPGDLSASELRAAGVSTLDAVMSSMPDHVFLDIEVKDGPADAFVDVVATARGDELRNAVVSSFVPAVLRNVQRQRPNWPLWLNAYDLDDGTIDLARELGCVGVSVEWHAIDERALARAGIGEPLEIAAWTVRRRPTFDRLARLGVGAVCVEGAALDG